MKLAEAAGIDLQKLGRVVRHSDAQSGGPGAIMVRDDTTPLTPGSLALRHVHPHPGPGREGPAAWRSGWARPPEWSCRWRRSPCETWLPDSACRTRLRRRARSRRDGRAARARASSKMNEVYGWEMPNIEGDPYFDLTVDHLFGTIWTRPGLSMRDKRLMTLSAVTARRHRRTSPRSRSTPRCTTASSPRKSSRRWPSSSPSTSASRSGPGSTARCPRWWPSDARPPRRARRGPAGQRERRRQDAHRERAR